jgi:hypothetical protein
MPGLLRVPSAEADRQGSALRLACLQVIGLGQDGQPKKTRLRPNAAAGAWTRIQHAAGRLPKGTRP